MHKLTLLLASLAVLLLSACASSGKLASSGAPVDPAVTAQKAQQDFQWACFALMGADTAFKATLPLYADKIGADGVAIEANAAGAITAICAKPLDTSNAQALVQKVMDAAGQIAAVVAKAQSA